MFEFRRRHGDEFAVDQFLLSGSTWKLPKFGEGHERTGAHGDYYTPWPVRRPLSGRASACNPVFLTLSHSVVVAPNGRRFCTRGRARQTRFDLRAPTRCALSVSWPGNVRELQNRVQRGGHGGRQTRNRQRSGTSRCPERLAGAGGERVEQEMGPGHAELPAGVGSSYVQNETGFATCKYKAQNGLPAKAKRTRR